RPFEHVNSYPHPFRMAVSRRGRARVPRFWQRARMADRGARTMAWSVALATSVLLAVASHAAGDAARVLTPGAFAHHVDHFNAMEDETVVNEVANAGAWAWMQEAGVPLFECADGQVEEIYWYRWWALRKHLRRDPVSGRFAFTEFITKPRFVSSALGH